MTMKGVLICAKPMAPENVAKLEAFFSEKYGAKVVLQEVIDEELIGGFRVRIGGNIYDMGMDTAFEKLSNAVDASDVLQDGKVVYELGDYLTQLWQTISDAPPEKKGTVVSVGDGIAVIKGMKDRRYYELIEFHSHCFGIAMNLREDRTECILIGDEGLIEEGQAVFGTGKALEVPVGECMLGRVVDPLGRPLDEEGTIHFAKTRPIEANAAPIIDRKPVSVPLETGCLAIDAMIPLGRGQRQLIIGDRQLGKTTLAIDTIINQKGKNVLCVYVAIGQKASTVAQMVQLLKSTGAMEYTVVVSATAAAPTPMQYIAPYAGCAIAEEFMYSGRDVLIVYDDLSKHAVAYRTISLLLKRPPGREAYPGDVFYLHSRLLERSACLSEKLGGGTMTAIPIIETLDGDISAYIPTNVISITDGQIFLQSNLFHSGVKPAVSVGLSVSRVGGAAQTKAIRRFSGQLRLELAQYREKEVFARFGTGLDSETQALLKRGRQFVELLKQPQHAPYTMYQEAILLYVFVNRLVPDLPPEEIAELKVDFLRFMHMQYRRVERAILNSKTIDDKSAELITRAFQEFMAGRENAKTQ